MSVPVEYVMRRFAYYGAYKLGVIGRLERFERLVEYSNKRARCLPSDVVVHYVDDIFIKILSNTDRRVRVLRGTKAIVDTDDVDDPVNNDNYVLLPVLFGFGVNLCPDTGGSCSSTPPYPCASVYSIQGRTPICCASSYYLYNAGINGTFVDNPPYITNYSTGSSGLSAQIPSTPGVVILNFGFGGPSCLPSSGVTLYGPVIMMKIGFSSASSACASSCPSGSICGGQNTNYCPGTTYTGPFAPFLYFTSSLVVMPNGSYAAWIEFQLA